MAKSNFQFLRLITSVFGVLSFLTIAIVPITDRILTAYYFLPNLLDENRNIEKHHEAMLTDLKSLEKAQLFKKVSFKQNVQQLVTQHVGWRGAGIASETNSKHLVKEFMKVSVDFKNASSIQARLNDPALELIDAAWIEKLSDYDHFDFSSNPVIQSEIEHARNVSSIDRFAIFSNLPIPDYLTLRDYAFVYFLQQLKLGKGQRGLETFHHVAYLAHSSGNLLGQMTASYMLRSENNLAAALKLQSNVKGKDDAIIAYRKLSAAWSGIVRQKWIGKWNPNFDRYLTPDFGACSGACENTTTFEGLKDYLQVKTVFESDFRLHYKRMHQLQNQLSEVCHMENYQPFFSDVLTEANPIIIRNPAYVAFLKPQLIKDAKANTFFNPARLPYVRRILGLEILAKRKLNSLKYYDEEKR